MNGTCIFGRDIQNALIQILRDILDEFEREFFML